MDTSFLNQEELSMLGLAKYGKNVLISRKASIYDAENISLGSNVRIDDFCILSGKIDIQNYVHISAYSAIFAGESGVLLEDFVTISGRCNIYGKSDDYSGAAMTNPTLAKHLTKVTDQRVIFMQHSILGCACTVLPGVVLAEGTSVGCMSLVLHNTKPWKIYAGIPVKILRDRQKCPLKLQNHIECADDI